MTMFGLLAGTSLHAQKKPVATTATIKIRTSAGCSECKDRIESKLKLMVGVNIVTFADSSTVVSVSYDSKKTTPDKIRRAISAVGCDADGIKANPQAKAQLPPCCQKSSSKK